MATKKKEKVTVAYSSDPWGASITASMPQLVKDTWFKRGDIINVPVWQANFLNEPLCCGFPVLGNFMESQQRKKKAAPYVDEIVKCMKQAFVKRKLKYICAYVPDKKNYDMERTILEQAGFKPALSLKSKHGKYTNTRWEWFAPTKEEKADANDVPAFTG